MAKPLVGGSPLWRSFGLLLVVALTGPAASITSVHEGDAAFFELVGSGGAAAGPSGCTPFGEGVEGPYNGWVYKTVGGFTVGPGNRIAFDLGATNDADVEVNLALATTASNGVTVEGAGGFQQVCTECRPKARRGNAVAGDYELEFTLNGGSFTHPEGGGLVLRVEPTGEYAAADTTCTAVMMSWASDDPSGRFLRRFYGDADGLSPWSNQVRGSSVEQAGARRPLGQGAWREGAHWSPPGDAPSALPLPRSGPAGSSRASHHHPPSSFLFFLPFSLRGAACPRGARRASASQVSRCSTS